MAETLTNQPEVLPPYVPDKPRLLLLPDATTIEMLDPIYAWLEDNPRIFQRVYSFAPGVPIATLRSLKELYPRMTERGSEFAVSHGIRDFQKETMPLTAQAEYLDIRKFEDNVVLGVCLSSAGFGPYRTQLMRSAFQSFKRYGQIYEYGDTRQWVAKNHEQQPFIPLARVYRNSQEHLRQLAYQHAACKHFQPGQITLTPWLYSPEQPEETSNNTQRATLDPVETIRFERTADTPLAEWATKVAAGFPFSTITIDGATAQPDPDIDPFSAADMNFSYFSKSSSESAAQ